MSHNFLFSSRFRIAPRALLFAHKRVPIAPISTVLIAKRFKSNSDNKYYGSQDNQNRENSGNQNQNTKNKFWSLLALAGGGAAIAGVGATIYNNRENVISVSKETFDEHDNNNTKIEQIQYYSCRDVAWHNNMERGVWITYNNSVYDITQFIQHHPGGSRTIMMGAGGDVGPFWQTYTVHHAPEVQQLLASYKIGEINLDEREAEQREKIKQQQQLEGKGPYSNEPERSPLLIVQSKEPFNAETPAELLAETHITPTDIFFVRNHLPVPEVDINDYEIEIVLEEEDGNNDQKDTDNKRQKILGKLTYQQLKDNFRPHTIDAVIQCSGNRRSELKKFREIKGLDWELGAIGNAQWTGARLVDVLRHFGLNDEEEILQKFKHVQVEGLDCDMSGQTYGASITAEVALDAKKDVLLAYEMNGKPLTRDHGFPVRFVAPGIAGARSVKWLSKIILSDEESHSHWQRNDYKSFSPNVDMFNVDYKQSMSIQEMPVQSAICEPLDGATIVIEQPGAILKQTTATANDDKNQLQKTFKAKGYAWSGGGKTIARVDLSIDNGTTWITANLHRPSIDEEKRWRNRDWSWSLWTANIPIPESVILALKNSQDMKTENSTKIELLCRAFDSSYNSQPERPETIWNLRGVVNNAWHRVNLNIKLSSLQ